MLLPGGRLAAHDAYALRTFANVYLTVPGVLAAILRDVLPILVVVLSPIPRLFVRLVPAAVSVRPVVVVVGRRPDDDPQDGALAAAERAAAVDGDTIAWNTMLALTQAVAEAPDEASRSAAYQRLQAGRLPCRDGGRATAGRPPGIPSHPQRGQLRDRPVPFALAHDSADVTALNDLPADLTNTAHCRF